MLLVAAGESKYYEQKKFCSIKKKESVTKYIIKFSCRDHCIAWIEN